MLLIFSVFDNAANYLNVFILFEYLLVSSITYWSQPPRWQGIQDQIKLPVRKYYARLKLI